MNYLEEEQESEDKKNKDCNSTDNHSDSLKSEERAATGQSLAYCKTAHGKRKFSYLTKDLSKKLPTPVIEGRNIFDLRKKSYADSYDYNIDVIYPSNHARIDFRRIVPNKHLHKD